MGPDNCYHLAHLNSRWATAIPFGPFSMFPMQIEIPRFLCSFPPPTKPSAMLLPALLRRSLILSGTPSSTARGGHSLHFSVFHELKSTFALSNTSETISEEKNEKKGFNRWFTLPPYTATVDGSVLGNRILNQGSQAEDETSTTAITALKWVLRCCPELPRSLVQKLFRLRKVPS